MTRNNAFPVKIFSVAAGFNAARAGDAWGCFACHIVMFLPLAVAVLANIGTFAFFGAVNLVAEIDARGKDAAKFDSVRFHTHQHDRVFINVKN